MNRVTVSLLCALALPTAALAQQDVIGIPVGSLRTGVVLEDLQGERFDLADHIGKKPVLLEFWATWCEDCEALLPRLREAHRMFGKQVEFFAIAVAVNQNQRRILRHLERQPYPFPVLWDDRGTALRSFSVPATSYVVVLDADGRVAYTGVGPDQDVLEALAAVVTSTPPGR